MNKRIYLFDNLKAVLIVLVVIGHLADTYIRAPFFKGIYVFIYAFHMPLFIFVSGYFHRNEDIKRKIVVYFSIGYILKIVDFILSLILDKKAELHPFSEDGASWYLFALCAYIGLTYLLKDTDLRLLIATAFILGCFSGYYDSIGDFLVLSRIIVFYPYYLLGVASARLDTKKMSKLLGKLQESILLKYLAVAVIAVWAYWCFGETDITYKFRRLFTGRNPFGEDFRELGCLYRLLCYGIAILLCMAIVFLASDRRIKYISALGTKTLQIYFWHWPIVYTIRKLLPVADFCKDLYGQMCFLLLAVPMVIILAAPIFEYPMKWIMKYKHELSYEEEIARLFKE